MESCLHGRPRRRATIPFSPDISDSSLMMWISKQGRSPGRRHGYLKVVQPPRDIMEHAKCGAAKPVDRVMKKEAVPCAPSVSRRRRRGHLLPPFFVGGQRWKYQACRPWGEKDMMELTCIQDRAATWPFPLLLAHGQTLLFPVILTDCSSRAAGCTT